MIALVLFQQELKCAWVRSHHLFLLLAWNRSTLTDSVPCVFIFHAAVNSLLSLPLAKIIKVGIALTPCSRAMSCTSNFVFYVVDSRKLLTVQPSNCVHLI